MNNNINETKLDKNEYNRIPVYYCKDCGSLHILIIENEDDYCGACGSMSIGKASIDAWIELQEKVYKSVKPIKYNRYGRK